MNKYSKIYVAGHQGLVGSSILRVLEKNGFKNIITKSFNELDLRNQEFTNKFFKKEKPEYVFLAAAKVGGILANNTYKAEFIYDNLMISANVINSAYKFGVKKLINLGSSCIYPKLAPQPLKEEYILSDYLEPTNESYAIAKISAIKLCRYYNEQYGTNFISVMPTNLYGPYDNFNLETAHVLPAFIRKFHLAKILRNNDLELLKKDLITYSFGYGFDEINLRHAHPAVHTVAFCEGCECRTLCGVLSDDSVIKKLQKIGITADYVKLWGTGSAFREFLYVDEIADVLLFLMQNYDYKDIGEIINVGTGQDIRIKDLAKLIKNIVGFEGKIEFDVTSPDGTPKKLLDVSKINKLGWKHKINLEDGLKKVYSWYLNNLNKEDDKDKTRGVFTIRT
ncbi:GDP-L-fucose synthase [Candidatus Babeliales bacterium]|nr:GDP-L-fucose synthase [Candidatus Babeliales bacterium]